MEKYFIGLDKMTLDELEIWRLLCRYSNYETCIAGYTINQLVISSDGRLGITTQRVRTILKGFEKQGYVQFLTSGSKGKESTLKLTIKQQLFNNNATNNCECLQEVEESSNNNLTTNQQLTNNTTKKKKKEKEAYTKEFDLLWGLYPRKIGKPKAFSSYKKLMKVYEYEQIKEAVEIYIKEIEFYGTDERFIKHGSTFFNCIEEDYIKANKKAPTAIGGDKKTNYNPSICKSNNNYTNKQKIDIVNNFI